MSLLIRDVDYQAGVELMRERHAEKPFKSWAEAVKWWREYISYDSVITTRFLVHAYLSLDRNSKVDNEEE